MFHSSLSNVEQFQTLINTIIILLHEQYTSTSHRKEFLVLLKSMIVLAIYYALFVFIIPMIMFLIFSIYTTFIGDVTPRKLFVTMALIVNLRLICIHFMVHGVFGLSDSAVSLKRIKVRFDVIIIL